LSIDTPDQFGEVEMGTRTEMGRGRRGKRGLASFVSFLLLFAFALGQGSSLFALADTDPVATEDVVADGTLPGEEAPAEEAPGEEAPGEEAPAEEAPAEEAPAEEAPAEEAPGEEAPATSDDDGSDPAPTARRDHLNVARVSRGSSVAAPVGEAAQLPDTPGAPSGDGVQPVLLIGNQNCAEVVGDALLFEYRHEPVVDASVDLFVESEGLVQGTLVIDVHGSLFDFTIEDGDAVAAVVVKGGDNANLFDYRPGGNLADTDLHAPVNPMNDQFYGLSHLSFCWTVEPKVPGIDVEKECPADVPFGEDITYTITVTNTGNEDLENVEVSDLLLGGDITGDFNFPDPFPVDGEVSAQFTYTPGAGEDPVENSVTASGDGVESGDTATDTDECTTDITHESGILVVKECPESVPFGDDVTFTITVTNTGDEALENVLVTDELLGGDITADFDFADPFPVGGEESAEFTYTPGPNEDPVENSVTASGDGVDSEVTATSTDECDTDVVHAPAIEVTKACPALVAFGEDVTFTITVTNTGSEDLGNVSVTDELLGGDITDAFGFGETFAAGAEESAEFTYTPGPNEDPVENSVTASGDGVDSEVTATATDVCATDVSNPAIQIVKTVSEEVVPVGSMVTYTYVITNTGDVTLYDISVDDDIMGHIGDIAVLEPGTSVTLTKDFVVGDEPVVNIGTAVGEDILGRVVSADDDAFVSPIAGENPPNPPGTPFTGSDAGRLGLITMILAGIGVTVVASTRRRRSEREAA
jgi:hypothetical protein